MLTQRARELRVDLPLREVRVAVPGRGVPAAAAEADRRALAHAAREDPRERVRRALVEQRVRLEPLEHARGEGALRAAVRPMQQQEAVRAPFPREVRERAVERLLHLLLPDEVLAPRAVVLVLERQIEEAKAPHRARRSLDVVSAVMIEAVAHITRRIARVPRGVLRDELEVLLEGEHPPLRLVAMTNGGADLSEDLADVDHRGASVAGPRKAGGRATGRSGARPRACARRACSAPACTPRSQRSAARAARPRPRR